MFPLELIQITFAYVVGSFLAMAGVAPAGTDGPGPSWLASRPQVIEFDVLGKKFPIFHQVKDLDPATYDYSQIYGAGIDDHRRFSEMCFADNMYHKPAWVRFHDSVVAFNEKRLTVLPAEEYKVIVFQRHGQGWHNVAEEKYGTPAWNCYWAQKEGDGNMTWSDPVLSPQGEEECRRLNSWYKKWFGNPENRQQYIDQTLGVPMFESYYVSPLTRAIQTANMAFGDIPFPESRSYKPIVKELLREDISTHTCDRRSTKSEIAAKFPNVVFEDGFAEKDTFWDAEDGETREEGEARARAVLEDIFASDNNTWISITTHGGMIRNMLKVLNHRPFPIKTGQILPVYVKANLKWPLSKEEQAISDAKEKQRLADKNRQKIEDAKRRQELENEAWSSYASAVVSSGGAEPTRPITTSYGDGVKGHKTCESLPVVTSIDDKGCICGAAETETGMEKSKTTPTSASD